MDSEKKRKYTIGGTILALFVGLTVFNNVQVVKATDDQWCTHDGNTCMDNPNNKCSDTKGWSCRHVKTLGDGPDNCGCTSSEPDPGGRP